MIHCRVPSRHLPAGEHGMMQPMQPRQSAVPSTPRNAALRGALQTLRSGLACLALVAVAGVAGAQDIKDGSLLVASTDLKDSNFSRSVVLVIHHDDKGTVGLVLNRITLLSPATVFPELKEGLGKYAGKLFRGGPVGPTQVLFLVRGLAAAVVQGPEVIDHVFLSADADQLKDIAALAEGPDNLRLYAGHAEWGPGQLEREISSGAWTLTDCTADQIFAADPGQVWQDAIGRRNAIVADASIH